MAVDVLSDLFILPVTPEHIRSDNVLYANDLSIWHQVIIVPDILGTLVRLSSAFWSTTCLSHNKKRVRF